MKTPHDCPRLRERVYDYRRGELSELERALFEQELASCPECAAALGRLIEVLDLAHEASPEDWLGRPIDAHAAGSLFASVLLALHQGAAQEPSPESDAAQDDLLVALRLGAAPFDRHERRIAQVTALAHEASPEGWLGGALDADALFARISAQLNAAQADAPQDPQEDSVQTLRPLRALDASDTFDARLGQVARQAYDLHGGAQAVQTLDADALFAALSARLDSSPGDAPARDEAPQGAPVVQLRFPQLAQAAAAPGDEDDSDAQGQRADRMSKAGLARWIPIPFLAAAAAALAVGAWIARAPHDATGPSSLAAGSGQLADATPLQGSDALLATLTPAPTAQTPDSIKILASQDAAWTLSQIEDTRKRYTLTLTSGTVLVEFLPTEREALRVVAGDTEVQVVGTVFYVSAADDPGSPGEPKPAYIRRARVGVLQGKVRVKRAPQAQAPHPQPDLIELGSGQELAQTSAPSLIPAATLARGATLIDLDVHAQRLRQIAARGAQAASRDLERGPEPVQPADATAQGGALAERGGEAAARQALRPRDARPPSQPGANSSAAPGQTPEALPHEPNAESLRQQAQLAMRSRDYQRAASLYEGALRDMGRADSAMTRLELANLYVHHLNQPRRAITHLRSFVQEHPKDIAAPTARQQLCKLLGPDASAEALCSDLTP